MKPCKLWVLNLLNTLSGVLFIVYMVWRPQIWCVIYCIHGLETADLAKGLLCLKSSIEPDDMSWTSRRLVRMEYELEDR